MSLITRVPGDMWVRMMSKSVSLSLCPTIPEKAGFGLAADAAEKPVLRCIVNRTHLAMKFVVFTSMYCYNFLAHTLLWLCSLYHCMHWSWSAKICTIKKKREIDDGKTVQLNSKRLGGINKSSSLNVIHQGPTNAMHVFVQRATCVKHSNRWLIAMYFFGNAN